MENKNMIQENQKFSGHKLKALSEDVLENVSGGVAEPIALENKEKLMSQLNLMPR